MSTITINKLYPHPIGGLVTDSKRILGALKDEQYGASVADELSPTVVTDLAAQIELLEKLVGDRATNRGSLSSSVKTRADAVDWLDLLSGSARTAAKATFAGQDSLLHGEFGVGRDAPRDLPTILRRGTELLAACKQHEEALSANGWGAKQNTALEAALKALDEAHEGAHISSDEKEGMTAEHIVAANALYRQCRAVQGVARYVYPARKAAQDPSIVEARARFLLGEFPRRRNRPPADDPPSTGGTTGTTSGSPAGGTSGTSTSSTSTGTSAPPTA